MLAILLKKLKLARDSFLADKKATPASDHAAVQHAVHESVHEHLLYSECFLMLNNAKIFEHYRYPHLSQCPECQVRLLETLRDGLRLYDHRKTQK